MAGSSFSVHGESITDGDSSGGVAVTLYDCGSPDETRTLGAKEVLHVTDVQIFVEGAQGGTDVWLVADSKAAGKYVTHGHLDQYGGLVVNFRKPFVCAPGVGLKFYGADADLNVCLVEGFIEEA